MAWNLQITGPAQREFQKLPAKNQARAKEGRDASAISRPGRLPLTNWNLHFGIAARCGRFHGGGNGVESLTNEPPAALTQNCELPLGQILLVLDVLVAGNEHVKRRILGGLE